MFARKLPINERTLEKLEQGRVKPNPHAAALVLLVRRYPDTLERLEKRGGRLIRRRKSDEREKRKQSPPSKTEGRAPKFI